MQEPSAARCTARPPFEDAGEASPSAPPDNASNSSAIKVELLYFDGCPNWQVADHHLRALATELGFELGHRLVTSPEDAQATRFRGSPTILVDGHDPFASEGQPFGMSCRIYQTPQGPSGSPTIEQLRSVLGG